MARLDGKRRQAWIHIVARLRGKHQHVHRGWRVAVNVTRQCVRARVNALKRGNSRQRDNARQEESINVINYNNLPFVTRFVDAIFIVWEPFGLHSIVSYTKEEHSEDTTDIIM